MDFVISDELILQELEKTRELFRSKMDDMQEEEGVDPGVLVPSLDEVRQVLLDVRINGSPVDQIHTAISMLLIPHKDNVRIDFPGL